MKTESSRKSVWGELGSEWLRMWLYGWLMAAKFALAYVVVAAGTVLPFELLAFMLRFWGVPSPLPPAYLWPIGIVGVGIWLPLTCYVAGSWIGFCPRVDRDEKEP